MNNPFAKLEALRSQLPSGPAPIAPPSPWVAALRAKLVVRAERKGHGGKTMTRIMGVELPEAERQDLLRGLKKSLGCGATLDGADLLLQGDVVPRAADHLRSLGATRVVCG